jgi:hypothetical protein
VSGHSMRALAEVAAAISDDDTGRSRR